MPSTKTTPILTPKHIAESLGGAEQRGKNWQAKCPCHDDDKSSLSISEGDTQPIIVNCFAGCRPRDIIAELKGRGLWPNTPKKKKGEVVAEYPYFDPEAGYVFSKLRYERDGGKTFEIAVRDDKALNGYRKGLPRDVTPPLFNLVALSKVREEEPDRWVFVVEGEKDVLNLERMDIVAVCNFDGAGNWSEHYTPWFEGLNVVIVPDNDKPGRDHARTIREALAPVANEIRVLQLPNVPDKGDVSDWIEGGGSRDELVELLEQTGAEVEVDWRDLLLMTSGKVPAPLPCEHNGDVAMTHHPALKGAFGLDRFTQQVITLREMPFSEVGEVWDDNTKSLLGSYLQQQGLRGSFKTLLACFDKVATENSFDSLLERVEALEWDGVERLATWLCDYCGAKGSPEYLAGVGTRVFIAGAARAYATPQAPAKVDEALVLEGPQGIGKSRLVRAMALDPEWFSDNVPANLKSDDAIRLIQGKQVVEIPELTAIKKTDNSAIKEYFSRSVDIFIKKYKEGQTRLPRRNIFIPTHNPDNDGYLTDPTGARRINPVEVKVLDVDGFSGVVEQLWAEGVTRYKKGERWWSLPGDPGIEEAQRERFREHPLAEEIRHYLTHECVVLDGDNRFNVQVEWTPRDEELTKFFPADFWEDRYGEDYSRVTREVQLAISNTFTHLKWSRQSLRNPRRDGRVMKGYRAPERKTVTDSEKPATVTESGYVKNPSTINDVTNVTLVTDSLESNRKTEERTYDEKNAFPLKSFEGGPVTWVSVTSRLEELVAHAATPIGLDIETTALRPAHGEIRLLQVWTPNECLVFDLSITDLDSLKPIIERGHFVAFNAQFELAWLRHHGITPGRLDDAKLAYAAIYGGTISLERAAKRFLGTTLDKTLQTSDWSGDLSLEQIEYALKDAEVAYKLWEHFVPLINEHEVGPGYELLLNALIPVAVAQEAGMRFDRGAHQNLVSRLERGFDRASRWLGKKVPEVENWNSPKQIQEWLRKHLDRSGRSKWPRTASRQLSVAGPAVREAFDKGLVPEALQRVLAVYMLRQNRMTYLKTFGPSLAEKVEKDGRVYGDLQISGAVTGRMSSSNPNLQNFPTRKGFRSLFVAGPGNQIVVCDYSQIEVRVGGLLAEEPVLEEIFRTGQDVHTASAAAMFHKEPSEVTKRERKQAKALTFGMQYGMGLKKLANTLQVPVVEAQRFIEQWKAKYPALAAWRDEQAEDGQKYRELFTQGGRRIELGANPSPSVCYNYPVQGSAADVMYAALTILVEELVAWPGVKLLAVVHDEVVLEAPREQVEEIKRVVEVCMQIGYQAIFEGADLTGLVEASSGDSWGVK